MFILLNFFQEIFSSVVLLFVLFLIGVGVYEFFGGTWGKDNRSSKNGRKSVQNSIQLKNFNYPWDSISSIKNEDDHIEPEKVLQEAKQLMADYNFEETLEIIDKAILSTDRNVRYEALCIKSDALSRSGKIHKSLSILSDSILEYPNDCNLYFYRSYNYESLSEQDRALIGMAKSDISKAIELSDLPENKLKWDQKTYELTDKEFNTAKDCYLSRAKYLDLMYPDFDEDDDYEEEEPPYSHHTPMPRKVDKSHSKEQEAETTKKLKEDSIHLNKEDESKE